MFKWMKRIVVAAVAVGILTAVCIVSGASSYVRSSGKMIQTAVKDSIPIEFELQRARDLLDELVPELRANIRLVAAEDVEVATLENEINDESSRIEEQRGKVRGLRTALRMQKASYNFDGISYEREEIVTELERKFDNLRMAEKMLDGRKELLKNRRRSLQAAIDKLEKTRSARVQLAAEIEALESQFRLLQAQSDDSDFSIDDSKLAQTRDVIGELKKRLAVAQRVMVREAKFVDNIPIPAQVDETSVVERVDSYLGGKAIDAPADSASADSASADSAELATSGQY